MKTLKNTLLLFSLFLSITVSAQIDYDISNIIVDEKFDNKSRLIARTIRSYGKQGEEELKVRIIVNPKNAVKELTVNDKKIMPLMFKEYRFLTDYVINYADREHVFEKPKGNAVTKVVGQNLKTKLTKDDEELLLKTMKKELLNDGIISADNEPFDLSLTGNDLFINAQRQEKQVFQKYKGIYDKLSNIPLSKTTYFQITQTL